MDPATVAQAPEAAPAEAKRPQYTPATPTAIWKIAAGETAEDPVEYVGGKPKIKKGYREMTQDKDFVNTWGAKSERVRSVIDRIKESSRQ